jgi:hypothetical protein
VVRALFARATYDVCEIDDAEPLKQGLTRCQVDAELQALSVDVSRTQGAAWGTYHVYPPEGSAE